MLFLTLQCLQAYLDLKKKHPNLQNETKERLVNNCHEYKLIANQKNILKNYLQNGPFG